MADIYDELAQNPLQQTTLKRINVMPSNPKGQPIKRCPGLCAICGQTSDYLKKDHCHKSNRSRGLLCNQCNLGLGHFSDDPERLRAAAAYIELHRKPRPPIASNADDRLNVALRIANGEVMKSPKSAPPQDAMVERAPFIKLSAADRHLRAKWRQKIRRDELHRAKWAEKDKRAAALRPRDDPPDLPRPKDKSRA